jgi:hypothetical protein
VAFCFIEKGKTKQVKYGNNKRRGTILQGVYNRWPSGEGREADVCSTRQ